MRIFSILDKLWFTGYYLKISLIFCVFIIFLFGSTGLIEITISQNPIFSINSKLLNSTGGYNLSLSTILLSKEFNFLLLSGLLLTFALPILAPLKAFILTMLLLTFTTIFAAYSKNVGLIPIEYCLLTIIVIYIVNVLISYVIEILVKWKGLREWHVSKHPKRGNLLFPGFMLAFSNARSVVVPELK